jgi:glutaredoxin 3
MFIEVYGKEGCAYCDRAKELLEEAGKDYSYLDVVQDETLHEEMMRRVPTARTVPQVFVDGQSIGGFDELRKLAKTWRT